MMRFFMVCFFLATWAAAAVAEIPYVSTLSYAPVPSPANSGPVPEPVPSPGKSEPVPVDCSTLIYNMMDCLSYIQNGSNETKPEASCCSGLKSVVKGGAECICVALESSESLGIDIDMNKAHKLSSFCHVSPNPMAKCEAKVPPSPSHGAPSKSPTPPHAANPPASPKTHSKAPAPAPASSRAYVTSASHSFIFVTFTYLLFSHVLA